MYGFHKRVGLSDNSMKASERKNKSPSEYYNPYFRRGHPNLLWLINKPKGGGTKKKGKKDEGGEGESEDDVVQDDNFTNTNYLNTPSVGGRPASTEVGVLQKKDLVQVKNEIDRLQQQQVAISDMLTKLRREHMAIANQATMFQTQHNRHEQSINAILTFLANVFRKSLEEQGGTQSVQDLLGHLMPNGQVHGQNQMHQGNIVDLGEYVAAASHQANNSGVSPMNSLKRAQRLLPAAPQAGGRAGTVSPSPASPTHQPATYHVPQMGSVTELFDASPSETNSPTAFIKSELQAKPSESMMRIIQDTNAGKPPLNLGRVATPQSPAGVGAGPQRNGIPVTSTATSPVPVSPMHGAATGTPLNHHIPSPQASGIPDISSLSPILSTVPPPPSLHDIQATQAELEALQRMQDSQRQRIDELTHILGPLSPSGRIPGLEGEIAGNQDYFNFDHYLDTDAFHDLNYDAAFSNGSTSTNADGNDFNFNLEGAQDFQPGSDPVGAFHLGGVTDAQSGGNSPSTASTEVVPRSDLDTELRDAKRRRVG
jgi:heat shock transcription factor, other eukaryote